MPNFEKLHRHALQLTGLTSPTALTNESGTLAWALAVAEEWAAIVAMWTGEPVEAPPARPLAVVPELGKRLPVSLPDDLHSEEGFQR